MTEGFNIKVEGTESIVSALAKLPETLRKSAERAVLRAGITPIRKAINARVPVDTGNLKKSIGISVSLGRGYGYGQARAGPRSGVKFRSKKNKTGRRHKHKKGKPIDAAEYAWYLETGTPNMTAKPFIRPAMEDAQGEVLDAMAAGLDKHLTRVAARLAKK